MNTCSALAGSILSAAVLVALASDGSAQGSCCGDQEMYVSVGTPGQLYRVDAYAGSPVATLIGATPVEMMDIAIDPETRQMYGSSGTTLFAIDKNTGNSVAIGPFGPPFSGVVSLEFSGRGKLYCGDKQGQMGTVDLATGDGTLVGNTGQLYSGDQAFLGSRRSWYVAWPNTLRKVVPATAVATTVGVIAANGYTWGLEFDCDGTLYGATSTCYLMTIDPATAAVLTQDLISGLDKKYVLGMTFDRGAGTVHSYCTTSTTTLGCAPVISATGDASVADSSGFTLHANNLEGQRSGLFFHGTGNLHQSVPWAPGSTSTLCLPAPFQRLVIQSTNGNAGACNGWFSTDWREFMSSNPLALGNPLFVGQCFDAQAWFRDPSAPQGTNLSNAMHFEVLP
jgi:hypothetical protein